MRPYILAVFTAALFALPLRLRSHRLTLRLDPQAIEWGLVIIATSTIAPMKDGVGN